MADGIDKIIAARKPAEVPAEAQPTEEQFFSLLGGEGLQEHFLEVRLKNGLRTCFSYADLLWFNFDPEAGCLDLEFGGFLVTIKGRGLAPRLFNGFKGKRISWVQEASSEMQDHKENETYIEEITVTPPKDFAANEAEGEPAA
jgi:hypothetical protein